MNISIQNRSLKSFVGRLQALEASYPLTLLSMAALDGIEIFQLNLKLDNDEELAAFAQDAKFGFGEHFSIERSASDFNSEYKTEHFVDVAGEDAGVEKLFNLRKQLNDENINFSALEFSSNDDANVIRAYAHSSQEQETIAKLVG